MAREDSSATCRELAKAFAEMRVLRPMRVQRYDAGEELAYDVTGIWPARPAQVRVRVEKFVGGGFAGQVYRVKALGVEGGEIAGLNVGGVYALKILIPPSAFSTKFRDALYKLAFGAPFSLQVLPAALRAGSIWQKLIRRAAAARLGTERAVADVLGTFVDARQGSCGEIREWVEGRQWQFEVDDRIDARWKWKPGRPDDGVGSPEYRAKRVFMAELVELMHEMGAAELARQYEWWTCKSQPNVLKRQDEFRVAGVSPACDKAVSQRGRDARDPAAGLTGVDFRAGLVLLPFLPMSPADIKLILRGLLRGRLVQFDRGDLGKLRAYVDARPEQFADMRDALAELESAERQYRDALPDLTHHHVRLLYDRGLWSGILDGAVTAWETRNTVDADRGRRLRSSRLTTLVFALLGAVPLLAVAGFVAAVAGLFATRPAREVLTGPIGWGALGGAVVLAMLSQVVRRLWGRADLRRHYTKVLTSLDYLRRALRARTAEKLINWRRAGRVSDPRALRLLDSPIRFLAHLPLSILPAGLHRFLTDARFARETLHGIFVVPIRLLVNPHAREAWMIDLVNEGHRKGMVTDDDRQHILAQIKEPYIQTYLKNMAVHLCFLPVTQTVAAIIAIVLILQHPEWSWKEAMGVFGGVMIFFQVIPISPGSIARGSYVLYLLVRTRKFSDYNVAVLLAFFKYIGYLAFPVQMAYRYPALARFMAGHFATGAASHVPVFGEHGALLEHSVFDIFYNYLLTLRRRIADRAAWRRARPARIWHAGLLAVATAAGIVGIDLALARRSGALPTLAGGWYFKIVVAFVGGYLTAAWAGGMRAPVRTLLAVATGAVVAMLAAAAKTLLPGLLQAQLGWEVAYAGQIVAQSYSGVLLFGLTGLLAAIVAETRPVRSPTTSAAIEG